MALRNAVVVGSGPNGLAAAITLARAGAKVTVLEAAETVGGGMRSAELTLPGFRHDVCSAIHPLAVGAPFFRNVPLQEFGLEWIHSPAPLAHPLDDGSVVLLERSLEATAHNLGPDGAAWRDLMEPFTRDLDRTLDGLLAPLLPPRHPLLMARFGLVGLRSARGLADARFSGVWARALFAGIAAHSIQPLDAMGTAAFGIMLGLLAHAVGWPLPRGGSQSIADAMARYFESLGGELVTNHRVSAPGDIPAADTVLFDLSPDQVLRIGGDRIPYGYRRRLEHFEFGPGSFKVDWALSGPIPWRNGACARAATVHVGGTLMEIVESERAVSRGEPSGDPFVLVVQPSLFDETRAPAGRHTGWAYCHVPNGSTVDMAERIERQVERFAPGFRERILARHVKTPAELQHYDANYVGGDIGGGANTLRQTLARPMLALDPYHIPVRGWYLCSASTPPGGGVHGMSGFHAARAALSALA